MIAFVRGVIAASTRAGSMLKSTGSTSTKTGFAPSRAIAPAVAKKLNGVVTTSSPSCTSSAISAITSASVPLETPTACFTPEYAATSSSSRFTFGPRMKCCEATTSAIATSTSGLIVAYWRFRSKRGTCMGTPRSRA